MDSFLFKAILVLDLVLSKVSGNAEGDVLNAWKTNLADPNNVLQSWDPALANPCTWFHVTCNRENRVTRLDLGYANLSGQLVPQLGQLTNLKYFHLYDNNISGRIPDELGNLTNLETLDLSFNSLTDSIPDSLSYLNKLRILRLNNNNLSGNVPMAVTTVASLQVLDLSNNQLKKDIPIFRDPISFVDNVGLFLPKASPNVTPQSMAFDQRKRSLIGNSATGSIAGGVGAGAALLFVASAIAVAWWQRRKLQNHLFNVPGDKDTKVHLGQLKRFSLRELEFHLGQLKRFSLRELEFATDNFSNKSILGRGGFGTVYKGCLADGSLIAVKRLKEDCTQGGQQQFQTEVEMISMAVHRNLLRLHGFCMTPTERLLVYPFMANGSVASCLQGRPKSKPPLEWGKRRHIALGAARGLAYLHDQCEQKIIHRDVKAANILLDEDFEAVVGDFGLAKLMDNKANYITTNVCGTIGHIAPECYSTGKSSEKTDVFAYGVMLLELITGWDAVNLARRANDNNVTFLDWVKSLVKDKKLGTLMDGDLQGQYNEEEVEQLVQVALLCIQSSPKERPKMSEVVTMLEGNGLAEKWAQWQQESMFQQNFNHINYLGCGWIVVESTSPILPDRLSGP